MTTKRWAVTPPPREGSHAAIKQRRSCRSRTTGATTVTKLLTRNAVVEQHADRHHWSQLVDTGQCGGSRSLCPIATSHDRRARLFMLARLGIRTRGEVRPSGRSLNAMRNSQAAAPVPICESRSSTCIVLAFSRACRLSGSLMFRSNGSPVFGSDWMSMAPRGTSRITRRRPFANGPPERRIETPTILWASAQ